MKLYVSALIALGLIASTGAVAFNQGLISIINRTGEKLSIISLDKPFSRSDVSRHEMIRLNPGQKINHVVNGRVLGWWQSGRLAKFTVIDRHDRTIVFIKNDGEIKTVHGSLKEFDVSNTKANDILVYSKNPYAGEEKCVDCAQDCYEEDGTLHYCDCLDFCWDDTRDLVWRVQPGQTIAMRAAKGTQMGVVEDAYEDGYDCEDGACYQTITTRYFYSE